MATVVAPPASSPAKLVSRLPGNRYDHFFFSGMALLLLATVFVGFAPTTIWQEFSARLCLA